ncbi:MAG: acetyl-CoA carboxylase, carboxyltransferase subunit beta [Bacilli bacterium]
MNNFIDDRQSKVQTFKKDFRKRNLENQKTDIPGGLFIKCEKCNNPIYSEDLDKTLDCCPKCNHHFRISANKRLAITLDNNSFSELFENLATLNPLDFPEYIDKISKYQSQTSEVEAFVCGTGEISEIKVAIGVLDSYFLMGSMGSVVGEKVTRLIEFSTENKLPLIIFSASGGARMQEGIFSLMQMAKTSAALKYHDMAGLLYISVLTNPTTGGVSASFASLGDIIIAEEGALIGFAGQRVIKQTIQQDLPEGFQTSEFQKDRGFVDIITNRRQLKALLSNILRLHGGKTNE